METPTPTLYANDPDGRISCFEHVGNYAQTAITARPNADEWDTPLGTWYTMTTDELATMTEIMGRPVGCECCAPARPQLALVK